MQDLFIRYFNGELSPQERQELFRKLQQSPEDKKVFAEMQNVWALSSLSKPADKQLANRKLAQFKKAEKKRFLFIILDQCSGTQRRWLWLLLQPGQF